MRYQIDKGVDIPVNTRGRRGGRELKYPWNDMQPGDSFQTEREYSPTHAAVLLNSAKSFAERHGKSWEFTTRKIGNRVRIWRVK